MHFNVYDVFYSTYSHHHVLAAIAAIFRAMCGVMLDVVMWQV